MRRLLAVPAAVALVAAAAAPAGAETLTVSIPARVFLPRDLQAVAGDDVRWSNGSGETHDIVAPDGAFASGPLGPGGAYSQAFPAVGTHPYVCTLHSEMSGVLDVVPVALAGPSQPVARGEAADLVGRAPAGTASVTVEAATPGGSYAPLATVAPGPDGRFTARDRPDATTSYRAVAPGGPSPAVTVPVVDRVRIGLRATLGRRLTTLHVSTDPARPGATAVLQLYSPERFAWRRTAHGTLDASGRMTLTLARRVRRRARVVILDARGAAIATSRAVPTWRMAATRPGRSRRPAASPHGASPPRHEAAHAPPAA